MSERGRKRREENKFRCMYNVHVQCCNSVFNKAFELEERLSDEEIEILTSLSVILSSAKRSSLRSNWVQGRHDLNAIFSLYRIIINPLLAHHAHTIFSTTFTFRIILERLSFIVIFWHTKIQE